MLQLGALVFLLASLSCTSFDLVELPAREADVYPTAHERGGVVVAVEEVLDARRSERYFGADLPGRGILPLLVIVSNYGEERVRVRPSDLLLLDQDRVVDPLPVERVVAIPQAKGLVVTDATEARLERLYRELALRERVLAPDESYRGVVFFDVGPPRDSDPFRTRFFRMTSLFSEPPLRLNVVLTELESGERTRFGPFGVQGARRSESW
jgi:hypothetical protein